MRIRIGRALLYGSGLGLAGVGAYSVHNSGYDSNNLGKSMLFYEIN
jgi:hypothetical protein